MMTSRSTAMRVMMGIASSLVAVACLSGCSTVQVQHTGRGLGAVEPVDALTVVLDYAGGSPDEAAKQEARLFECVQQAMHEEGRALKLIPPDEFRRLVFPDFDITSAPRSTESFVSLLKVPQFREKIDSLQMRYIVTVRDETSSHSEDVIWGVGGYGAAIAILGSTHEKKTELKARLLDMKSASETGCVTTTVESTGFYGWVVILPVILPAMTESTACQRFGREVVKSISSRTE